VLKPVFEADLTPEQYAYRPGRNAQLTNLYMRRFVLACKRLGLEQSLGSRIVINVDDLAILCRRGKSEEAVQHMRAIMGRLKLTSNLRALRFVACCRLNITLPIMMGTSLRFFAHPTHVPYFYSSSILCTSTETSPPQSSE